MSNKKAINILLILSLLNLALLPVALIVLYLLMRDQIKLLDDKYWESEINGRQTATYWVQGQADIPNADGFDDSQF